MNWIYKLVIAALRRFSEKDRNAAWLESHGFKPSPAFNESWFPPQDEAEAMGLETNTSYDLATCLHACSAQQVENNRCGNMLS